ncbi:MAG: hypothetical protein CM1200mP2_09820 [Planctomycetaceae bacterium]|nr:MAG: hypothetical protein CM1200mP2_09820 [Planctomycetaceae bacterium]
MLPGCSSCRDSSSVPVRAAPVRALHPVRPRRGNGRVDPGVLHLGVRSAVRVGCLCWPAGPPDCRCGPGSAATNSLIAVGQGAGYLPELGNQRVIVFNSGFSGLPGPVPEMQLAGDEPDSVPVADSLVAEDRDPDRVFLVMIFGLRAAVSKSIIFAVPGVCGTSGTNLAADRSPCGWSCSAWDGRWPAGGPAGDRPLVSLR